ncbi:MAG: ABC transporter substrate-binding protein, partial [Firmicutes bacterium]|nr:ABC transporter substrate-binding protein [Bacillota bacterium]
VILLTPYSADDTSALNQSFVKAYQSAYGELPNQFAADAYDCIYALHKAITALNPAGSETAADLCENMIAEFTSMTFDGLTGANMTWAKDGTVSKSPNAMVIQNGAYVGL